MKDEKIVLTWEVARLEDSCRVTAMYCFKNCVNNLN